MARSESRWSRRALCGLAAGFATTLAACSSGSRREAERGRARDAEQTSVVESMQQTATAGLVMGTPPADPTAEPDE